MFIEKSRPIFWKDYQLMMIRKDLLRLGQDKKKARQWTHEKLGVDQEGDFLDRPSAILMPKMGTGCWVVAGRNFFNPKRI